MQLSRFRTVVICLALGLVSQFAYQPIQAQTATLPGTIFYLSDTMKAMRPDGTGKVQVLPKVTFGHLLFPRNADPTKPYSLRGNPCDQVHGNDPFHDRWYLTFVQTNTYSEVSRASGSPILNSPHFDLFAYRTNPLDRSQVDAIQVTDLFGIYAPSSGAQSDWSNDSNENGSTSFIGLGTGRDIRRSFRKTILPDGSTFTTFSSDLSQSPSRNIRIPWTASDIQAQWLTDVYMPFRPTTDAEFNNCICDLPGDSRVSSPDGFAFAAVSPDRILSLFNSFDRSMTLKVLWNGTGTKEPKYPANPVWSRDGLSVAFINQGNSVNSSSGGVWSVPIAGGVPRQLAKNVPRGFNLTRYSDPLWSDDSKFILIRSSQEGFSGISNSSDLLRIPAAGGPSVNLTADTNEAVGSFRWVSNVPAQFTP